MWFGVVSLKINNKTICKCIIFALIFVVLFFSVQNILTGDSDTRDSQRIAGFFELPDNSLDAVFLGSSATYAFWNAPVAWSEYGIAVYPLSNSAQPTFAAKYLIEDARKRHPDALYIINMSHILEDYETYLDKLLINYPFTINKLKMANYLFDIANFNLSKRLTSVFPIFRYHQRWNEISYNDLVTTPDKYMGGSRYNAFLEVSKDVSNFYPDFTARLQLDESTVRGMNDLFDYCESENVKVLFIVMPQTVGKERISRQNTLVEMVKERGFDVLDLRKYIDEMKLNLQVDYYNERHTNIHGSLKVTDFLAQYFIENYGFKDKRGESGYENWSKASSGYYKLIKNYLLPTDYVYLKNGYNN